MRNIINCSDRVLEFIGSYCETETDSGKAAVIWDNEFNLKRPLYSMAIEDKIVFTRGTLETVLKYLRTK